MNTAITPSEPARTLIKQCAEHCEYAIERTRQFREAGEAGEATFWEASARYWSVKAFYWGRK